MAIWNKNAAAARYELERSEHGRDHASVDFERRLVELVRGGNVEEMERFSSTATLGEEHIGVMARKPEKQQEYMAVVLFTILSRAAAEGGMNREQAYSQADVYLQRLEECRTWAEILSLCAQAELDFAEQVLAARQEDSRIPYIEDCKAYIAKHLRQPFKVGDIAPAIGVNRSYLARRFSQVEGMTLQQYITRERCAHAAELLRFSDYPIAQIAGYFCFSSQSHFGRAFKAYSGMTPKEYRNSKQRNQ